MLTVPFNRPPNLCDRKIGMILLKNRKEIAFPIGVCSKIIKKNRKILSKHELGMVNIQTLSSKFRMVGRSALIIRVGL